MGPTQTNPGMHHPRMDPKSRPTEFQASPWAVALSVFDQHNIKHKHKQKTPHKDLDLDLDLKNLDLDLDLKIK